MQLEGKTAFITGAGRGIGRAIALLFAQEGCAIAAAARTETEVRETAAAIQARGGKAFALVCDVTDPAQVAAAVRETEDRFGHIDILVNNAGGARFKPFQEITLAEWQQVLDTNLTSVFHCIQAVLPSMIARRAGRIINISSVTGIKAIQHQSAYCAAKHGVNGLTKSLALELREYGIGVHAICPGGVRTRLSEEVMPGRDKTDWLTPEDIARTALYLATQSPRAATDIIEVRRFDSEPLAR